MKLSQNMMKLIIKMLILMMLFVIMFLISSFLYSARYWPDVYNYINANITIKRIPTISELDLTVIEVDFTTETYTTTDVDYTDSTVDDFDIDEFMKDEIDFKHKAKRSIVIEQLKDYIELPPRGIFVDYIFLEEPIKHETSTGKNLESDGEIIKTSVTGLMEDGPSKTMKTEVSEDPVVTEKYYTVQTPKTTVSKRCVDEQLVTTKLETPYDTEGTTTDYLPEHSTTKEGYLVGDDPNLKLVVEVTEEPVVLTTKANENELVGEEQATGYMRDLVDVSKLSTRGSKDVEMVTGKPEKIRMMDKQDTICHGNATCKNFTETAFPWVVTIFATNNTKDSQFSYYCDGALLSEKVIVTGARCMLSSNKTWEPQNVLVFLGKVNLQSFGDNEKVHKVKDIITHPKFAVDAGGNVVNDLALLVLEEAVEYKNNIQFACIHPGDSGVDESATTAWGLNGTLEPIFFNKEKNMYCFNKDEDIFCATYGNEVALCPSYGGVYASRLNDRWCLQGIFYGDPADRTFCFSKDVYYTSLKNYVSWIDETVGLYKNYPLYMCVLFHTPFFNCAIFT